MVSFTCDVCQEVVKKRNIEKHCMNGLCQSAWNFTCIDCCQVFEGYAYERHTSCINEEEKYFGPYARSYASRKICKGTLGPECNLKSGGSASGAAGNSQHTTTSPSSTKAQSRIDLYSSNCRAVSKSIKWHNNWLQTINSLLHVQPNHSMHYKSLTTQVVAAYVLAHPSNKLSKKLLAYLCLGNIPLEYVNATDAYVRLPRFY